MHTDLIRRALSDLREAIASERNPASLRDLVIEINGILDAIEAQLNNLDLSGKDN